MIKGCKICGISDPNTLNFLINHPHPPTFIGFICNYPSAKIFLGDSGAYTMGALAALNTITTNNLNPNISSFFFCTWKVK